MIVNFKFKNFLSFANACNFTMLANADKSHESNLIAIDRGKLSKAKIIYGANASGKTSFIKALVFMSSFIEKSNFLLDNNKIEVIPFKFREEAYKCPSEFSITFIKNGLKYKYEFSCTIFQVITEKLEIYYTAKPTTIFYRHNTDIFEFYNKDAKLLNEIKSKNTKNKLFLVTLATWNYEIAKPVVEFLLNDIHAVNDMSHAWKVYIDKILNNNEWDEYKKFCLNFLNNADFSINDISIKTRRIKDLDERLILHLANSLPRNADIDMNNLLNISVYNFKTHHQVKIDNEIKNYFLNLNEESEGTSQMFLLSTLLYFVLKKGDVIFIDEINKSLHPLLVEYIFKMFLDPEINKNNAQIISTSHDTNMLNLEIFRRDEILFTERNNDTGETKLFPLSDFSPRKNENIEKSYLLGRFGAVPFIGV